MQWEVNKHVIDSKSETSHMFEFDNIPVYVPLLSCFLLVLH